MIGRAARGGESSEDDGGRGGPHNINYQGRCFCKCGEHKIDHLSKKVKVIGLSHTAREDHNGNDRKQEMKNKK